MRSLRDDSSGSGGSGGLGVLIRRVAAYLVDCTLAFGVLMLVVQSLVLLPLRGALGIDADWFRDGGRVLGYVVLTISLPVWVYFTAFESSRWRATPGKRLLGLVVQTDAGGRLGVGRALGRTALKLLPWELSHVGALLPEPMYFMDPAEAAPRAASIAAVVLLLAYAGWVAWTGGRRAPYDVVLRTRVGRVVR